ncbi:hypothetical protein EDB19DRAFT_2003561 [Suillus lakei]|nr:hypothetical protein EDB19DRAFT_2003561 [Suillus lakei]
MAGRPSKKVKFSCYVDMNEAHPAPVYDRFRSYGIQHNGDLSVNTTYMLSQPTNEVPINHHPLSPVLPSLDDWNETEYQDPEPQGQESEHTLKRKRPGIDNPLLQWLHAHSAFLDELIRLEGCGNKGTLLNCHCSTDNAIPLYRCRDCFGIKMVCQACVIRRHLSNPLHRIDMWNSKFFESVTLKTLGLHVQLGHMPGERCYNAQPVSCDKFMVIDVHGIHDVAVDFCRCKTAQICHKQLAAIFSILELFHLLSFESKVSSYKFYHSLARWSDNTGTSPIKDCYSEFMQMMQEWHHIMQLMHTGRGHDPKGIEAAPDGGCVVPCPACPHPGINIPDGWEDSPPDISDDRDLSLNSGWAYFMEEDAYNKFLSEQSTEWQERSTCISHNVVNTVDTKASRGLAAMGVGLPNSVGDLQKGEKYTNMDYLVFSVLVSFSLAVFNLSYDITYGSLFVPKFHLKAHIQACHTTFSFNFSKWVGRTDGEAPECGWVDINRVAMSTREMGPGNHHDMLDDHFSDWNWKKTTMLGRTLLCKLKEATAAAQAHYKELAELEDAINTSTLALWRTDVEAWEEDNTNANPFETMTQATVHLKFTECERRDLQDGIDSSLHAEISPSMLIANGLKLKDQQRRLCADRKTSSQNPTDNQKAKIQTCSNTLQRKLDTWIQVQTLYMPAITSLCLRTQHDDSPQHEMPEDFVLLLPSQLDTTTPCNPLLCQIKWQLRYTQVDDALNNVHQNVCLHTHLNTFKTLHVCDQRASTSKKCASRLKYEATCVALDKLRDRLGMVGFRDIFWPLNVSDMRPIGDAAGQSEGRCDIPWIWKAPGVLQNNDVGLQDCLHVKWCKARARQPRVTIFEKVMSLTRKMQ